MGAITYTANARATLVTSVSPSHTAGTSYSIDVKFTAYTEATEMPKQVHTSLSGNNIETVLQGLRKANSFTLMYPPALHDDVTEFVESVAGGETFTIDPEGTVASADDPLDVVMTDDGISFGRIRTAGGIWRTLTMRVRPA